MVNEIEICRIVNNLADTDETEGFGTSIYRQIKDLLKQRRYKYVSISRNWLVSLRLENNRTLAVGPMVTIYMEATKKKIEETTVKICITSSWG